MQWKGQGIGFYVCPRCKKQNDRQNQCVSRKRGSYQRLHQYCEQNEDPDSVLCQKRYNLMTSQSSLTKAVFLATNY